MNALCTPWKLFVSFIVIRARTARGPPITFPALTSALVTASRILNGAAVPVP